MQRILVFCSIILILNACKKEQTTDLNRPTGAELAVTWEVVINEATPGFQAKFTIANQSQDTFPSKNWAIYFNQLGGSPMADSSAQAIITHITGDYYQMRPTERFNSIAPGESITFSVPYQGSLRKISFAPKGMYIVFENADGGEQAPEMLSNITILPLPNEDQISVNGNAIPLAQWYYEQNAATTTLPDGQFPKIIPSPVSIKTGSQTLIINNSWAIAYTNELKNEVDYLVNIIESILGSKLKTTTNNTSAAKERILLKINPQIEKAEGYTLTANAANGIIIEGKDAAGVFYGIQSLLSWLPPDAFKGNQNNLTINEVQIEDAPRFGYRGLYLDASRNFHSKTSILKILDLLSFYKINKLNLLVGNDEGWRLEIPTLPELTQVGARRGHTRTEEDKLYPFYGSGPFDDEKVSYGTGYYTKADFIEILQKAKSRHIEVILEFDTPGHSRAAIKAMQARYNRLIKEGKKEEAEAYLLHDPDDASKYNSAQNYKDNVMCICKEAPYRFWETVINEVQAMYKEAGVTLHTIHVGGDEVPNGSWEQSPICNDFKSKNPQYKTIEDLQHYFLRRVNAMLLERGLNTGGWEEIALKKEGNRYVPNPEFADKKLQAYVWISAWDSDGLAHRMANAGFPVIVCNTPNLYFDLAYNPDAQEPGLTWGGLVGNRQPFALTPENLFTSESFFNPPANTGKLELLTATGLQHILGIQAQLWSETIRGQEALEYMMLPKLLGLAERAWSQQPAWAQISDPTQRKASLDKAYNVFLNTAGQRDLPRLDHLFGAWNYRIAPPGAIIINNQLQANTEFPGFQIRYTMDGSEPNMNSTLYKNPVQVNGIIKLKVFDTRGRSSRTMTVDAGELAQ
ncbi:MAG: family 20 glycosylhydrolase [Saprospiraceae bacterium]|nr:family 20 glycosylhydrolase [Saprospiraceae bacterium]